MFTIVPRPAAVVAEKPSLEERVEALEKRYDTLDRKIDGMKTDKDSQFGDVLAELSKMQLSNVNES